MSFGLRTWGAGGALELDTDSFTYQVLHNQLYTITDRGVITVPVAGFDPSTCCAAMLPTAAPSSTDVTQGMPYMYVNSGSITIRSQNVNGGDYNGSTIQFRLLAMRYRN